MKPIGAHVQCAAVVALEQLDLALAGIAQRESRGFTDGPDLRLRIAELCCRLIQSLSVYQERFPFSSGAIGKLEEGAEGVEPVGSDPGRSGGDCGASGG
jgi:hypothetical protein